MKIVKTISYTVLFLIVVFLLTAVPGHACTDKDPACGPRQLPPVIRCSPDFDAPLKWFKTCDDLIIDPKYTPEP